MNEDYMNEDKLACRYVRIIRESTDTMLSLQSPYDLTFSAWRDMVEEMLGGPWRVHCFSTIEHDYYEDEYETD